jgi:hypothetical protein
MRLQGQDRPAPDHPFRNEVPATPQSMSPVYGKSTATFKEKAMNNLSLNFQN